MGVSDDTRRSRVGARNTNDTCVEEKEEDEKNISISLFDGGLLCRVVFCFLSSPILDTMITPSRADSVVDINTLLCKPKSCYRQNEQLLSTGFRRLQA